MGMKQPQASLSSDSSGKKNKKDKANNKKGDKKRKLTKDDIGNPENFQYVQQDNSVKQTTNIMSSKFMIIMMWMHSEVHVDVNTKEIHAAIRV